MRRICLIARPYSRPADRTPISKRIALRGTARLCATRPFAGDSMLHRQLPVRIRGWIYSDYTFDGLALGFFGVYCPGVLGERNFFIWSIEYFVLGCLRPGLSL